MLQTKEELKSKAERDGEDDDVDIEKIHKVCMWVITWVSRWMEGWPDLTIKDACTCQYV